LKKEIIFFNSFPPPQFLICEPAAFMTNYRLSVDRENMAHTRAHTLSSESIVLDPTLSVFAKVAVKTPPLTTRLQCVSPVSSLPLVPFEDTACDMFEPRVMGSLHAHAFPKMLRIPRLKIFAENFWFWSQNQFFSKKSHTLRFSFVFGRLVGWL